MPVKSKEGVKVGLPAEEAIYKESVIVSVTDVALLQTAFVPVENSNDLIVAVENEIGAPPVFVTYIGYAADVPAANVIVPEPEPAKYTPPP